MVNKLPRGWHAAKDSEGTIYYYNRQSNQNTYTHPTQLTDNSESAATATTLQPQDPPGLPSPSAAWPVAHRLYMIKGRVTDCFRGCLTSTVTSNFLDDGIQIQYEKRYCCYPSFLQDVFVPKKRLRAITVQGGEATDPRLCILFGLILLVPGVILFGTSLAPYDDVSCTAYDCRMTSRMNLEVPRFVAGLSLAVVGIFCFFLPCIKAWCSKDYHYVQVATDDHPADGSGFLGIFYDSKYTFAVPHKPDDKFLQGYLCTTTQPEDVLLQSSKVPPATRGGMLDSSHVGLPMDAVSSASEEPGENV